MDSKTLLELSVHIRNSSKPSRYHSRRPTLKLRRPRVLPDFSFDKLRPRFSVRTPQLRSARKENRLPSQVVISEVPHRCFLTEDILTSSLFVSNSTASNDHSVLRKFGVYAILSISGKELNKYPSVRGGYLALNFATGNEFFQCMEHVLRFIDTHISHGNVLIQCADGYSASCTVVIGYYMKKFGLPFQQAHGLMLKAVPGCKLSPEQDKWLSIYQRKLNID